MKHVKVYYKTLLEGAYDECIDDCPFDNDCKCGSVACKAQCKNCFGYGYETIWLLNEKNGFYPGRGWINCFKVYNNITFNMRLKRILYVIRINIQRYLQKFPCIRKRYLYDI